MKALLLLVFSFLLLSCSNKRVKNDLLPKLKGHVKSLRESCYDVITANPIQKGLLQEVTTYNYNKRGYLTEAYRGFYKERDYRRIIYKYDNDGNIMDRNS